MRVAVAESIGSAIDALPKHPERALLALLDAWRATRDPRIATALDRISRMKQRRALGGGSLKAMTARWKEVAEPRDALDLPRLMAAVASNHAQTAAQRLEVLNEFPDDPRIAAPLATFITVPPYSSGTWMGHAVAHASRLLERIADVRSADLLDGDLAARIRAAATAATVPLDEPARARLAELEAALAGSRSGEELLEAIYANPDDDAPRIVYADWLLEQGDAHGELIHLQLAGAKTQEAIARETELLKKLERKIIGPLAKVTSCRKFARGFLVACAVDAKNTRSMITASTAREWATVEEVSLGSYVTRESMPAFANVRRIYNVSESSVPDLLALAPPLELLGIHLREPETIRGFSRFPRLTTLIFHAISRPAWLGLLWPAIEHVDMHVDVFEIGDYPARAPMTLRRLTLRYGSITCVGTREADRWHFVVPTGVTPEISRALERYGSVASQ